ncbi:MAG: hypothetical protein WCW52_05940 [Elusimicrobiales bacterium]|jgi:hypothetical protein
MIKMIMMAVMLGLTGGVYANVDNPDDNSPSVDNPDAETTIDTGCNEVLSAGAPYDAATFKAALEKALQSKALDADALSNFLFKSDIEQIQDGSFDIGVMSFDDCNLTKAINMSLTKPAMLYPLTGNGTRYFGGLSLYNGDIYAEGFYRSRKDGVPGTLYPRRKYSAAELLTRQPWFEWDGKAFTPHAQGASLQLIKRLSGSQGSVGYIDLYRGTREQYTDAGAALATINEFNFDSHGGVFTTPDYSAARNWANPVVLSSRIPIRDLVDAALQNNPDLGNIPSLYIGIEYEYIEPVFLYNPGDKRNLFFDNINDRCVVRDPGKLSYAGPIKKTCK